MGMHVTTEKGRRKRLAARNGRPPRELAGEVDQRILDAARRLFLERGFAGASIDEIARLARAGKPTIYARFPTKEALFAAVAMRAATEISARVEDHVPTGATLEKRLVAVGIDVLNGLLVSDEIDFIRLSIFESRRFPVLTESGRMARERGVQAVTHVLSEVARSDRTGAFPAFAPERLAATTQFFLDLVVARLLMRALQGESLKELRGDMKNHVTQGVTFFLAACRHTGVT